MGLVVRVLCNTEDGKAYHVLSHFYLTRPVFADIENFTAWSSVREPGQVFSLLENIYGAFDSVAKRRGAYKVETIGDSVSFRLDLIPHKSSCSRSHLLPFFASLSTLQWQASPIPDLTMPLSWCASREIVDK